MYVLIKEMNETKHDKGNYVELECNLFKKVAIRSYNDGRHRVDFKVKYNNMTITCVAWNKKADNIFFKVQEDELLFLKGRVSTRYYDKNGEKIETTELYVTDI